MLIQNKMKKCATGLALLLSIGLLAGCGTISEIRNAIPDVEVDGEGGSVTLKGDDGESVTIDTDTTGEIPEWFPTEIPLPENYTIGNVSAVEYGEESVTSMAVSSPDDFDTIVAAIESGLDAAGLEWNKLELPESGTSGGMKTGLHSVMIDGRQWQISMLDYGDEDEGVHVSYSSLKGGE